MVSLRQLVFVGNQCNCAPSWPCMTAMGLGRVKTVPKGRRSWQPGAEAASGRDRSDQRLDPDDVHDPCQIIGQNR
jgi:hypothetical protein